MSSETVIRWLGTSQGRLAWRADGPEDGPRLLPLQRFRGTMDDRDPAFIAAVSRQRRLIRFDSAGIGRSGDLVPGSVQSMAALAAEVIQALCASRMDVPGWSLGGTVTLFQAIDDFAGGIGRFLTG